MRHRHVVLEPYVVLTVVITTRSVVSIDKAFAYLMCLIRTVCCLIDTVGHTKKCQFGKESY